MKRKIFAEKNYDLKQCFINPAEFKLFCDREEGFTLRPDYKEQAIAAGEALMDKTYPALTATCYLLFVREGDRGKYEAKYFERRQDLTTLLTAEAYENEGRFIDKILDLVWMILDESSWVIPAHVNPNPADRTHSLPYSYEGGRNYMDLFAGATGALLSWVYYLCRNRFDGISPVINRRLLSALEDRVIHPFICHPDEQMWMGLAGGWMNNWCPWIVSNVLNVCALAFPDKEIWEKVVSYALVGLDRFTAIYEDDGACDEGPNYWGAACGALYNACLVLYDMTGGKINAFADPLLKNMGEFLPKAYICGGYYLNFSDAGPKVTPAGWGADWARFCDSKLMKEFWGCMAGDDGKMPSVDRGMPYRGFRLLGMQPLPADNFRVAEKVFLSSLGLSALRETDESDKGLYISLKGHHNAASHNHLDVGNFVLFCDGDPIFIDAGVGQYTARTFNKERYTIWSMRSEYHNLPTVNGVDQKPGKHFAATEVSYNEETGALSMSLAKAYPEETGIGSFVRYAGIEDGKAIVKDTLTSEKDGEVVFHLMCNTEPMNITENSFTIHGHTVNFDPTLTVTVDCPDLTWPETERLPKNWDCQKIYRINLTAKLIAGVEQTYILKAQK